jgi:hypothetical protein
MSISSIVLLLAITINAIVLFVVIPAFGTSLNSSFKIEEYPDGYDTLATNLLEGNGYRIYSDTAKTLVREPGYPFLLTGIFAVFGHNFTAVKVTNMVLAIAAAWMMMLIIRKFSSNQFLISGTVLIFLLHPGTLIAESRGGVEMLFTFALTLFVLSLYNALQKRSALSYIVSGLVLGMTVLIRSTPLLFPVLLLGYLLIFDRTESIARLSWNVGLMVVAMVVVLSPWIVRNYMLTKKFVPTAAVVGISAHAGLYINSHLWTGKEWVWIDMDGVAEREKIAKKLGYPYKEVPGAYYQVFYSSEDELKFSNYLLATVVDAYSKSPMLFVKNTSWNLFNFWFRGKTFSATLINIFIQLPYLFLASIGVFLFAIIGRPKIIAPMILVLVYVIGIHIPIVALARYSVPLIPFLSVFVCMSVMSLWQRMRGLGIEIVDRAELGRPNPFSKIKIGRAS